MAERRAKPDSRLNAARYRVDHLDRHSPEADEPDDTGETALSGQRSMDARAQYIEVSIQQAMRRGDFDALPGVGKPIAGLGDVHDPDWWIRRKIQRENITGLGPPALTLRTEDAGLDDRLDAIASESEVREALGDFNRRVVEARRQLLGGPPVVTPTREIEAEVERWRERRRTRLRALADQRRLDVEALAALSRRERRAQRRGRATAN